MGSGHFLGESDRKACYIRDIRFFDENRIFVSSDPSTFQLLVTKPTCYDLTLIAQNYIDGTDIHFGSPGFFPRIGLSDLSKIPSLFVYELVVSGLDHSRFGIKGHVLDRRSLGSLKVELGLAKISIDQRYKKRNGGDQQREKEENVSFWSQRLNQISRGELPLDPMA
nr:hypothetical protein CFP56_19975 [Quercus suber]